MAPKTSFTKGLWQQGLQCSATSGTVFFFPDMLWSGHTQPMDITGISRTRWKIASIRLQRDPSQRKDSGAKGQCRPRSYSLGAVHIRSTPEDGSGNDPTLQVRSVQRSRSICLTGNALEEICRRISSVHTAQVDSEQCHVQPSDRCRPSDPSR